MIKKQGKRTLKFENPPRIISYASVVGKKEHEGPLSDEFDYFTADSLFGEKSFEKAESKLQKTIFKSLPPSTCFCVKALFVIRNGFCISIIEIAFIC